MKRDSKEFIEMQIANVEKSIVRSKEFIACFTRVENEEMAQKMQEVLKDEEKYLELLQGDLQRVY